MTGSPRLSVPLFLASLLIFGLKAEAGEKAAPLVIGETFTIESKVLSETRRINVYMPPGYAESSSRLPVLYMPDSGIAEDFLHIAGFVQVSVRNGTMRPWEGLPRQGTIA
jgi:enterochelin esterase-like enzyme